MSLPGLVASLNPTNISLAESPTCIRHGTIPRIVHERDRTGFEETKDFPIRLNSRQAARKPDRIPMNMGLELKGPLDRLWRMLAPNPVLCVCRHSGVGSILRILS